MASLLHVEAVGMEGDVDAAAGTLRLPLPGVIKAELDVQQSGTTVVLLVGGQRRLVDLPASLAGKTCSGARLESGWLELRFL